MTRPRKILDKLLKLLDEEPLSSGEICAILQKSRKVVRQNLSIAKHEGLLEMDALKKYHVTDLGKSLIDSAAKHSVEQVTFEVEPYLVDHLGLWDSTPHAKCRLITKDAKKIRQKDYETVGGSYEPKDGLVSSMNSTRIEIAVAGVVDSILDIRAKDMGLHSILDLEHRRNLEAFNLPQQFPGYDVLKRIQQLPDIHFKVLIEFDGKSWVRKQDFEDLENLRQYHQKAYQEMMKRIQSRALQLRQKEAFRSLKGAFFNIGERHWKELEDHRFFGSREELNQFIIKELKVHLPENKKIDKKLLQSLRRAGAIEYHERTFYRIKVNHEKIDEFLKIINEL